MNPFLPRFACRGFLVAAVAATWTACDTRPPTAPTQATPAPEWFSDVTARVGVDFVHRAGTNFFMPDQVGSGIALFDANADGLPDLYLLQNLGDDTARHRLFLQQPDQTFQDGSKGSGLDLGTRGMGAIAGDVNNDGLPDVVVTELGATRLFRNMGQARFEEVTRSAGIDNPRWAAPASFLDYDRDGWLDLVVGNYVDYDPTQVCEDVHGRRDFCAPQAFAGLPARLWRNTTGTPGAAPRFQEVTESSGLAQAHGAALGLVCADFNGDRWPDIFIADDGRPNRLFINQHQGRFTEEASVRGLALNAMGHTAANMGVAYADLDHDGLGDLFVTHLAEEFHALYRQDQPGLFTDAVARFGIQSQAWRGTGFGTVFADFNSDGLLDLAFVNGLVRRATPPHSPTLPGVDPWWAQYAQRAQLFQGTETNRLVDRSPANAALCGHAAVGRSLALGDLNLDGRPDLVIGNVGGPARILYSIAPAAGHWLRLRLVLPEHGGRDALGAEALVHTPKGTRWAVLQPATSYLASHEPVLHFGLAPHETVTGITVRWPDGTSEHFTAPPLDTSTILRRGTGTPP
ncbi:MAG: CRTAC1 family protein [Verrucomicrobiales bacterium]|nr:CRTAC1 family protein [Verrucomicrobiales bacterium]